jgi:single-stranded DNA-binding protein
MIRVLIEGELFRAPERRTSKTGTPFATAKMSAKQSDGEGIFISLICFDTELVERLTGLQAGAALAVAGRVSLTTYTAKDGNPRPGMDMVVEELAALAKKPRKQAPNTQPPAGDPFVDLPGAADVDWLGA